MSLLGKAALAMWWDISADVRVEFEDWHSHEHFRERLGIPGFKRATRWRAADGGEGVFQMYELDSYQVLSSSAYLDRLNAPTPWSQKMMPHHRNMIRSQCRILESAGGSVARYSLTVRLSPAPGKDENLRAALQQLIVRLADRPGCVGGHLLKHETPSVPQTREQTLRGGDRVADWVFLANGYDANALQELGEADLSESALTAMGSAANSESALYQLSYSTTPEGIV